MVTALGDPRAERELRERIEDFHRLWNRLPADVKEDVALEVGHARLLTKLTELYTAQGHPAGEHLRAALDAIRAPDHQRSD